MHGVLLLLCLAACAGDPVPVPVPAAADAGADAAGEIRAVLRDIESAFNRGDLVAAMEHFTADAVISGQGEPDVVGAEAIRQMYGAALGQVAMKVAFRTEEIQAIGDLAVERGTYTVEIIDKATGNAVGLMDNRHMHVMRRDVDGKWRTWRMMVNSARGGRPPLLPVESEARNPLQ